MEASKRAEELADEYVLASHPCGRKESFIDGYYDGFKARDEEVAALKAEHVKLLERFHRYDSALSESNIILREALEYYAQSPVPDKTSIFAKSAEKWGEISATWDPLLDMGDKAREALEETK